MHSTEKERGETFMIDSIDAVVNAISGVLYKPYVVPLILMLAGIYFTIRLGLVQFRLFG